MSSITVKFIDKEYRFPVDLIAYARLVESAEEVHKTLMESFANSISHNVNAIEDEAFMIAEIKTQASKFVAKLLENEIYDRTLSDYLMQNKGYGLFIDTKKRILNQILSIRKEKLNTYSAGVQKAIQKRESSVTGLDFGIISGSFANHMIYAFMEASKEAKQEKQALAIYNKEIAKLDKLAKEYDDQEVSFVSNNAIPAMNTVFSYFAFELLDLYTSDLIRVGKFDEEVLKYINLERSSDLLNNLNIAANKQAVIYEAFVACPFNPKVYICAQKYNLLDYTTFHTGMRFVKGLFRKRTR